jgi:hypothetical protein
VERAADGGIRSRHIHPEALLERTFVPTPVLMLCLYSLPMLRRGRVPFVLSDLVPALVYACLRFVCVCCDLIKRGGNVAA